MFATLEGVKLGAIDSSVPATHSSVPVAHQSVPSGIESGSSKILPEPGVRKVSFPGSAGETQPLIRKTSKQVALFR